MAGVAVALFSPTPVGKSGGRVRAELTVWALWAVPAGAAGQPGRKDQ